MPEPTVYNCICQGVSAQLLIKTIIEKDIKSVEALQRIYPFGEVCEMCVDPVTEYIKWYNEQKA